MNKKRIFLAVLALAVVGFLGYLIPVINSVGKVLEEDAIKRNKFWLTQGVQSGDIIFQTSQSNQSKAIQLATRSAYSHMGIIYQNGEDFFVYEAVQPVKLTPLTKWVDRGTDKAYVVKRLKNADSVLTKDVLAEMKRFGERFKGRDYDSHFEWSDDKIYCSELVWKIYKHTTGIEIGELQHLSEFDLTDVTVKQKLMERYGDAIPMDEWVISPEAMFSSDQLIFVKSEKTLVLPIED